MVQQTLKGLHLLFITPTGNYLSKKLFDFEIYTVNLYSTITFIKTCLILDTHFQTAGGVVQTYTGSQIHYLGKKPPQQRLHSCPTLSRHQGQVHQLPPPTSTAFTSLQFSRLSKHQFRKIPTGLTALIFCLHCRKKQATCTLKQTLEEQDRPISTNSE